MTTKVLGQGENGRRVLPSVRAVNRVNVSYGKHPSGNKIALTAFFRLKKEPRKRSIRRDVNDAKETQPRGERREKKTFITSKQNVLESH